MSITRDSFLSAVQAAVDAPAKSGTKWDSLEQLFAAEGIRGNGSINNGGGADRTTRIRQLATSKTHKGHNTRDIANHSVFVIGGGSVSTYNQDPGNYLSLTRQALIREHPTVDSCLIMIKDGESAPSPVLLVTRIDQESPVPYVEWWPGLEVSELPSLLTPDRLEEAAASVYPAEAACNVIYFGPPGTGKSTEVQRRVGVAEMFRVQFHPEYSHSDFIGSYRPVVGHESDLKNVIVGYDGIEIVRPVNYFEFVPGPFSLALQHAFKSPHHVFLVIEEINRGDCASIFGDFFQLLDRDDNGRSQFGITPKQEILRYFMLNGVRYDIAGDTKLYLPPNLSLLATMNTSDQSLFPMDAAFKRRWQWVSCPLEFDDLIGYTGGIRPFLDDGKRQWDWIDLLERINANIVRDRMEDKQLGPWFIKPAVNGAVPWDAFLNKCLFYLWHDVFKDEQLSDYSPFRADGPAYFDEVLAHIRDNGLEAGFKPDVLRTLAPQSSVMAAIAD
jgi:hypothetical protein